MVTVPFRERSMSIFKRYTDVSPARELQSNYLETLKSPIARAKNYGANAGTLKSRFSTSLCRSRDQDGSLPTTASSHLEVSSLAKCDLA